ncbi:ATP-binding protein [Chitinimonas arctica]|uniref:ATP-binding protein n=1 Tax=Chitinimonas arctica TaxID=2594795 RepID=A0A516SD88_9NEIS|nr:ATP-binding protein [Chitinimonas arctica]QDQ26104.1 ATP-binding protein [Chitinimonas arctica]
MHLIDRAMGLLDRLEAILPPAANVMDWSASAYRWRRKTVLGSAVGWLEPVRHPHGIRLRDLQNVEAQKHELVRNTNQFVAGRPANNMLLTGARGTGKSSLVKAVLNEYADAGLRLVEVEKDELADLADIVAILAPRPEKFIVFCDDLSFEEGEGGYKALKSVLDGSIAATSSNILIYATSNRRHLLPEYFDENSQTRHVDGEIHPADVVEEKISLSERFGLWLSFYPFSQDEYLAAVRHWLLEFGVADWSETMAREALNWALGRGSRSGRVAWQFARDRAGREGETIQKQP